MELEFYTPPFVYKDEVLYDSLGHSVLEFMSKKSIAQKDEIIASLNAQERTPIASLRLNSPTLGVIYNNSKAFFILTTMTSVPKVMDKKKGVALMRKTSTWIMHRLQP